MMLHLDLFSGIGGFALACEWAGIETIGFVEIDKYCQKVLRKHWLDVPIVEDIRDVKKIEEIVANAESNRRGCLQGQRGQSEAIRLEGNSRIQCSNREGAATNKPIILITAGFPCQPFSVAGKQGGEGDDRYLWPETLAVIEAIKPTWILLENVAGIINLALDTVLSDLEGAGYSYETLVIPACAVNAPHRRDRIWIVGYASINGQPDTQAREGIEPRDGGGEERQNKLCESEGASGLREADVPNTQHPTPTRQRGHSREVHGITESTGLNISSGRDWWAVEPELGRVAHGIPRRVDRLKSLGNAIVPQVAFEIIKAIQSQEASIRRV